VASAFVIPWLVAFLHCPGQAGAQAQAKQPEPKVKITVAVILANSRCQCVHPLLTKVAAEVQTKEPTLTGFNLVCMMDMSLAGNAKGSFTCVEGATVDVQVHHCMDKENKICLAVTPPLQNEIVYKTVCSKFLVLITPYETKERVPAKWIAAALSQAAAGGKLGPLVACDTLDTHRCRDRLILAIRVQPCQGK
jgi:hypothetical protein